MSSGHPIKRSLSTLNRQVRLRISSIELPNFKFCRKIITLPPVDSKGMREIVQLMEENIPFVGVSPLCLQSIGRKKARRAFAAMGLKYHHSTRDFLHGIARHQAHSLRKNGFDDEHIRILEGGLNPVPSNLFSFQHIRPRSLLGDSSSMNLTFMPDFCHHLMDYVIDAQCRTIKNEQDREGSYIWLPQTFGIPVMDISHIHKDYEFIGRISGEKRRYSTELLEFCRIWRTLQPKPYGHQWSSYNMAVPVRQQPKLEIVSAAAVA